MLAEQKIMWESEESVDFADELYNKIAYLTIKSSNELAKEKGVYSYFEGSDWSTGNYFDLRGYDSEEWNSLKSSVMEHGMRNGYLMAVAPNSSTAKIGGSSDGIDPIYGLVFNEEKKNFKFRVLAPGLDSETYEYYEKNRFELDQLWSIKQNAARQRHIDQGVSFNLYVRSTIKAGDLLEILLNTWRYRLKSSYYIKSTTYAGDDCDFCHS